MVVGTLICAGASEMVRSVRMEDRRRLLKMRFFMLATENSLLDVGTAGRGLDRQIQDERKGVGVVHRLKESRRGVPDGDGEIGDAGGPVGDQLPFRVRVQELRRINLVFARVR